MGNHREKVKIICMEFWWLTEVPHRSKVFFYKSELTRSNILYATNVSICYPALTKVLKTVKLAKNVL